MFWDKDIHRFVSNIDKKVEATTSRINLRYEYNKKFRDMIIHELRVVSCELRVVSCELRVVNCELVFTFILRIATCDLRVASCELVFHHINSVYIFVPILDSSQSFLCL